MTTASPDTPAVPTLDRVQVLGKKANLLDETGEHLSSFALATPLPYLHNFAKEIKADDYGQAQLDVSDAVDQQDELKTPEQIERRLHHISKQAQAIGFDVQVLPTLTLGKLPDIKLVKIPTVAAPASESTKPA